MAVTQDYRPGLLSAVPTGLNLERGVLTQTLKTLALPALKRVIKVEILSRSAEALLPPHECGGSHHESHNFPVLTQALKAVPFKESLMPCVVPKPQALLAPKC